MEAPHAERITIAKADVDPYSSIEIVWTPETADLKIVIHRIIPGKTRVDITTEEIGPYGSFPELRRHLTTLFSQADARAPIRRSTHTIVKDTSLPPTHSVARLYLVCCDGRQR